MTLRWGFIGASRIGRNAVGPAVRDAGQVLHAVAARDLSRAKAFAAEFGAPRAYGSYGELLGDPGVEAVYIALTNDRHLPWVTRALEAGKHVLCEKPLAMDAAEVGLMLAAERASGLVLSEAFAYRFNHQIVRLQEIIASGELGRLVSAQVTFGNTLPPGDFRWTASLGGGAFYDIGCYCVDLLRRAFGGEPERVSAFQHLGGEVDASFGGCLEFPGGGLGQFTCSFESVRRQSLILLGSEALLTLDFPFAPRQEKVTLRVNDRVESFGPSEPYRAMVTEFADAVSGKAKLATQSGFALAQARSMDALFAAARSGAVLGVSA